MPSKTDDKYTDPELRDEVKEEIQAGVRLANGPLERYTQ